MYRTGERGRAGEAPSCRSTRRQVSSFSSFSIFARHRRGGGLLDADIDVFFVDAGDFKLQRDVVLVLVDFHGGAKLVVVDALPGLRGCTTTEKTVHTVHAVLHGRERPHGKAPNGFKVMTQFLLQGDARGKLDGLADFETLKEREEVTCSISMLRLCVTVFELGWNSFALADGTLMGKRGVFSMTERGARFKLTSEPSASSWIANLDFEFPVMENTAIDPVGGSPSQREGHLRRTRVSPRQNGHPSSARIRRPLNEAAPYGGRSLHCYADVMEGRGDGFKRLNLGRSIDAFCKCSSTLLGRYWCCKHRHWLCSPTD